MTRNPRSAHGGNVSVAIAAALVIAAAFAWGSNAYFSEKAAHERPSTVGQGSFDRRFEGAHAETPVVKSDRAVKIELTSNTPSIKEYTLTAPLPAE
jgi:hypothetical protein